MNLVKMIRQDPDGFKQWRRKNKEEPLNFQNADLSGVDLSFANLKGAYMYRANLVGANLKGSQLDGAILTEADLSGSKAVLCCFEHANLKDVKATGTNFSQSLFIGADMRRADLSGANVSKCYFSQSDLSHADFTGTTITGTDWRYLYTNPKGLFYKRFNPECSSEERNEPNYVIGWNDLQVVTGCWQGSPADFAEQVRQHPKHGPDSLYLLELNKILSEHMLYLDTNKINS